MDNYQIQWEKHEETNRRYNAKIAELKGKVSELEANLKELNAQWFAALESEIEGDANINFLKLQKKKTDIINEIAILKELITTTGYRKQAKLEELLPALGEARDKEHVGIRDQVVEESEALLLERVKYVLKCKQIGDLKRKGSELEASFESAIRKTYNGNLENAPYQKTRRLEYPAVNIGSTYAGIDSHIAPSNAELLQALNNGIVANFILWFAISGELLSEREARQKLEELKRKEKEAKKQNG